MAALRSLGLVANVALFAVVAAGLSGVVLGRVLPALGHPILVVAGPSMGDALPIGSAIVLEVVPPEELAVGDVVSLRSGEARAIFTHRIVRVTRLDGAISLETKGDANPEPDPSLTRADDVIGRVTIGLPWAGYGLAFLSTATGVLTLLALGAALIILGWLLDDLIDEHQRVVVAPLGT